MQPDVVIVGAGAAGVAAGLELRERGVSFVILEASGRVGGRAYTDRTSLPHPWDQGCYWFHCADVNPLVGWADRLGAVYEREDRMERSIDWIRGKWLGPVERAELGSAIETTLSEIYRVAALGRDMPVADLLRTKGDGARLVRCVTRLQSSAEPEEVSVLGYAEYRDTDVNLEVTGGYGNLIERMATGLPIRMNAPVTGISERPGGIRVETEAGAIEARAAIVTVSTNVLASGAIRFGSAEVNTVLDLIGDVPCGAYEKIALALRRVPEVAREQLFFWVDPGGADMPLHFMVPAGGKPLVIANVGGSDARDLARAGKAAMVDLATERLVSAFGADIRGEIVGAAVTGWQANPFVRGAYSYTKPGLADRRKEIIAAETGDIVFAGEAFSLPWHATAHGAYQCGRDVAAKLAARLAR